MKKTKFTSSAQKQQYMELEKSWEKLKLKHKSNKPDPVKVCQLTSRLSPSMAGARITQANIPSLVTAGGSCSKKDTLYYTGDKIIGIATIHKSCLQPIFNRQSSVDVAQMRR